MSRSGAGSRRARSPKPSPSRRVGLGERAAGPSELRRGEWRRARRRRRARATARGSAMALRFGAALDGRPAPGARSTTWALVPPKPKELTPARTGRRRARRGQGLEGSCGTRRRRSSKGMSGLGSWKCRLGGIGPVLQAERGLDQPGDAGRGLQVPDVGLDRADGAAARPRAGPRPSTAPRAFSLDRIADRRAGAVGLDVAHVCRGDAGLPAGLAEHRLLGLAAGDGDPVGAAVLVDRGAADHGADRVAVGAGRRRGA